MNDPSRDPGHSQGGKFLPNWADIHTDRQTDRRMCWAMQTLLTQTSGKETEEYKLMTFLNFRYLFSKWAKIYLQNFIGRQEGLKKKSIQENRYSNIFKWVWIASKGFWSQCWLLSPKLALHYSSSASFLSISSSLELTFLQLHFNSCFIFRNKNGSWFLTVISLVFSLHLSFRFVICRCSNTLLNTLKNALKINSWNIFSIY